MSDKENAVEWNWAGARMTNGEHVMFETPLDVAALSVSLPEFITFRKMTIVKMDPGPTPDSFAVSFGKPIVFDVDSMGCFPRERVAFIGLVGRNMEERVKKYWGDAVVIQAKSSDLRMLK